jgi:hypothetical protein
VRIGLVKPAVAAAVGMVALGACSPVKVGSAAIVGDQRITVANLDSAVSGWTSAYRSDPVVSTVLPPSSINQVTSSVPRTVLNQLVSFQVADEAAREHGINPTKGALDRFTPQIQANLSQESLTMADLPVINLVPPNETPALIRYIYETTALVELLAPNATSQEEAQIALAAALGQAAHHLKVSVSPQYGSYDFGTASIAGTRLLLSRPDTGTST